METRNRSAREIKLLRKTDCTMFHEKYEDEALLLREEGVEDSLAVTAGLATDDVVGEEKWACAFQTFVLLRLVADILSGAFCLSHRCMLELSRGSPVCYTAQRN